MNLKYLFCGAIVATTLQLKSSEGENQGKAFLSPEGLKELLEAVARRAAADPEHEKKEERRKQKLRLLDFLDARIERANSDRLNQINLYEKLSKDLKGTQQCIWSEETKLSRLYEEITNLEQERNELIKVLHE